MFSYKKKIYSYIRATFKYYIKHRRKNIYPLLEPHMDEILALASFLFISSSFISKGTRSQKFNFNWVSFLRIYKPGALEEWSSCAIRYSIDVNPELKELDTSGPKFLMGNFMDQYRSSIKKQHQMAVTTEMVETYTRKQMLLLELVLKVHRLYHKEIPKEPAKVVDLVNCLTQFKFLVLDVFQHKSEYVFFSFLVNLVN